MRGKKIKFEFTYEEIKAVKAFQRKGVLDSDAKKVIKGIYQRNIDPTYDPCEGCHQVVKENFKRLVKIMCESLGVSDLRSYKPTVKDLKTQSDFKEAVEILHESNKEVKPKKETLLQKIGKASRI
jgi:hypothetical protein